jgi:MipA family protein
LVLLFFLTQLPAAPIAMAGNTALPLWEIGLGAAPITMPAYRGSKNQQYYIFPMPYLYYRGDFLRIDQEGIRGIFYTSDRLSIDFSGDGAVPSPTDKEGPRRGMPDIDPVIEVGPSINLIVHESPHALLRLRLPVRAAFASDFRSVYRAGWKVHPHLNADFPEALHGWDIGINIGPIFADRRYHAFYYDVKSRYATAFREPYRSDGGYSGASMMFTSSRRWENIWAGFFFRYDNLAGATFTDSPVVETHHSFMAGFAIAWIFFKSPVKIPPPRDDYY